MDDLVQNRKYDFGHSDCSQIVPAHYGIIKLKHDLIKQESSCQRIIDLAKLQSVVSTHV